MDDIALTEAGFARIRSEITGFFRELWAEPELAGLERRAAARLAGWLESKGFAVVRAAGGIPTAFVARRSFGPGPRIAILAEYDALPGLGNDAVAERRGKGGAGHACGHNHIGPANCGAAIIAADVAQELGTAGEIAVVGCPAEEILWGKIALLKQSVFEGFDVLLTSHGDYQTGALSRPCMSAANGEFVFLGEAGHGGFAGPRNALSGAETAVAAITAMMRENFADCSVKHVLRRAGVMPSITPDEARLWYTIRHVDIGRARAAYQAAVATAEATAERLALGFRHQHISESRGYLANDIVAKVLSGAIADIGVTEPLPDHSSFMTALANAAGHDGPLDIDLENWLHRDGEDYYGQDDGEASWRIPLGRMNWAWPKSIPIHHWAWTALSGHEAGNAGPLLAAQALALTAVRLLASPALVSEAKAELLRRREGIEVDAPWLGAWRTMTTAPESFWDATWVE